MGRGRVEVGKRVERSLTRPNRLAYYLFTARYGLCL